MQDWRDEAYVLSVTPYGDSGAVVTLLTRERGRYVGFVRGANRKNIRGALALGARVDVQWQARLPDQLGSFSLETLSNSCSGIFSYPKRLLALKALCDLVAVSLPERNPLPGVFGGFTAMLDILLQDPWREAFVLWELKLLEALGYGLDLSACAHTGALDDLAYVSPRTGRAVSRQAGLPHAEKLLPLPGFLLGQAGEEHDILDGLRLTRYFLARHVLGPLNKPMPFARLELENALSPASVLEASEIAA